MVKMILTVPKNFDAVLFCNAATSMVRDAADEYERRDYDYSLGEMLRPHYTKDVWYLGDGNYYVPITEKIRQSKLPTPLVEEYEVNADFVDFAHLEALQKLQTICPQIEFHFENHCDGYNAVTPYDEDYFAENYRVLIKRHA